VYKAIAGIMENLAFGLSGLDERNERLMILHMHVSSVFRSVETEQPLVHFNDMIPWDRVGVCPYFENLFSGKKVLPFSYGTWPISH